MTLSTTTFGVNVTIEQKELLRRVARRRGIKPNALIRELIDSLREHDVDESADYAT